MGGNPPVKKKTKGEPICEPFFPKTRPLFADKRYRSLESFDRDVLDLLMYLYNSNINGGHVSLGVRAAAAWWGVSNATAWRALQRLQKAGFITEVHKGHMVPLTSRQHVATTWRLNIPAYGLRVPPVKQ
jgi:hypothetical protein